MPFLALAFPRPQCQPVFLQYLFSIQPHLQLAIAPRHLIPGQSNIMCRRGREISAITPKDVLISGQRSYVSKATLPVLTFVGRLLFCKESIVHLSIGISDPGAPMRDTTIGNFASLPVMRD